MDTQPHIMDTQPHDVHGTFRALWAWTTICKLYGSGQMSDRTCGYLHLRGLGSFRMPMQRMRLRMRTHSLARCPMPYLHIYNRVAVVEQAGRNMQSRPRALDKALEQRVTERYAAPAQVHPCSSSASDHHAALRDISSDSKAYARARLQGCAGYQLEGNLGRTSSRPNGKGGA